MSTIIKNNNLELGLKRFKTETARSGVLSIARKRADGYQKPGVRNREEKKINTINSKRNNRKNNY